MTWSFCSRVLYSWAFIRFYFSLSLFGLNEVYSHDIRVHIKRNGISRTTGQKRRIRTHGVTVCSHTNSRFLLWPFLMTIVISSLTQGKLWVDLGMMSSSDIKTAQGRTTHSSNAALALGCRCVPIASLRGMNLIDRAALLFCLPRICWCLACPYFTVHLRGRMKLNWWSWFAWSVGIVMWLNIHVVV